MGTSSMCPDMPYLASLYVAPQELRYQPKLHWRHCFSSLGFEAGGGPHQRRYAHRRCRRFESSRIRIMTPDIFACVLTTFKVWAPHLLRRFPLLEMHFTFIPQVATTRHPTFLELFCLAQLHSWLWALCRKLGFLCLCLLIDLVPYCVKHH